MLPLSGGDALTVKRFLNAAEFRQLIKSSARPIRVEASAAPGLDAAPDVALEIDPTESGVAMVQAYLLDWTFRDFDDRPIVIRDQPPAVVRAALDSIDAESYMEVQRAIQGHDRVMRALIAEEKKVPSGSPKPELTSPSVG